MKWNKILFFLLFIRNVQSFLVVPHQDHYNTLLPLHATTSTKVGSEDDNKLLLAEIRSMRVKEIKDELRKRQISTTDVFEKEELVKRLHEDRMSGGKNKKKTTNNSSSSNDDVIEGDLLFTSMETGRSIPAYNKESIQIEGVGTPYPTIQIRVNDRFDLTLLLDTACSGFVLRPSVVKEHNLKSSTTTATITGAGGNVNTGVTQLDKFTYGGTDFGSLPAAVQEIGALPQALDGIIGLSFLNQFACVEFDMINGKLRLYRRNTEPPIPEGYGVSARGEMISTKLGIYSADITIDGRGPIKMLVDSGATSSFLSWQGVSDLGYTKSMLQELSGRMGVMGSDNFAMQLTHTLPVEIFVNIGEQTKYFGVPVDRQSNVCIDVGNIAILESELKADRVVGILGMDLLQINSFVRVSFSSGSSHLTFIN